MHQPGEGKYIVPSTAVEEEEEDAMSAVMMTQQYEVAAAVAAVMDNSAKQISPPSGISSSLVAWLTITISLAWLSLRRSRSSCVITRKGA